MAAIACWGCSSMIRAQLLMTALRTLDAAKPISVAEVGAIRVIAADGKHRKHQLAVRHQFLIVDRVLGKRRKLSAEGIMDPRRRAYNAA